MRGSHKKGAVTPVSGCLVKFHETMVVPPEVPRPGGKQSLSAESEF